MILTPEHRITQRRAAHLAIILRERGLHRGHSSADVQTAIRLYAQRYGVTIRQTDELEQAIAQRCGQMLALELLNQPLVVFGDLSPNSKAARAIRQARAQAA